MFGNTLILTINPFLISKAIINIFTFSAYKAHTVLWNGLCPLPVFCLFFAYFSHVKDSDNQTFFLYYTKIMQVNTKYSF